MNLKKIVIAFLLLLYMYNNTNAKSIVIDSLFRSKDIYNTLKEKNNAYFKEKTFVVSIKNNSLYNTQLYISIINPTIDKIDFINAGDTITLGDYLPYTKRVFKHPNIVYPLFLENGKLAHLKIIVHNPYSHTLNFRINISTENSFIQTTNHDNFFNGVFYGIVFMFLLLLICIYIFSKSNFFILYFIINVFTLLFIMLNNGTGYQYIWFFSAFIQKYIVAFLAVGYLTVHIIFIRAFFAMQLRKLSKYLLNTFLVVVLLFGAVLLMKIYNKDVLNLPGKYIYLFIYSAYILYGIMVLILSIYAYIETKSREAIWVFIGMILQLFSWVIFINNEFVDIRWLNPIDAIYFYKSNIYVPHLTYGIYLLEIFVVTIFIVFNYHNLIRINNLSAKRLEFLQNRNINTFVLGQEEERKKISKEIENDISVDIQILRKVISVFHPENDEKQIIPAVLAELDRTLDDIKNITDNYVAPDIQNMKLKQLITTATDKLYASIKTDYLYNNLPDKFQLTSIANINIYRVFQEISNNIIKHSGATLVQIITTIDNKTLQIKVVDDGNGFDDNITQNKGIGLMNIESRINSLYGNFYILSNASGGTTIHLILKLKDIS